MKANTRNVKCSKCGRIEKKYSGPVKPTLCEGCRGGKRKKKAKAAIKTNAQTQEAPASGGRESEKQGEGVFAEEMN